MSMIGIEFRTDGYLCDFIGEMISKYEANLVDAVLLTFNGLMAATDREAANCPQSAAYALLFKSKLNEFLAELNHSFIISDFNPYRDGLRVAISQLRQAGDAFAASIIESKANQKASKNSEGVKAVNSAGKSRKDEMWRKFYDAVVVAYNEMVCGASVKRAIEHVIKNEAWVNAASFLKDSRTGVILTTSAINKALQRWLDEGQYSGFEEIGELPKAFKKGKESREKLRRYYEVLKGLNKSEPSAAS